MSGKNMFEFRQKLYKLIPDKLYLKLLYKRRLGKKLNLNNPQTFSEKLQWLKLYDRRPEYSKMVDKYEAKLYVAEKIGEQYIIPTLGIWDSFEEIDFSKLPNQFVIKCTHDSGGLVICKDKATFDIEKASQKINQCMKNNFYWFGREWPYKNVKPRIIVEKFMTDYGEGESGDNFCENNANKEPTDYKMMCFDGKVNSSFVCSEWFTESGLKIAFHNTNWEEIPFSDHYPRSANLSEKTASYEQMVELVEKLSKDIPFVRVDFYEVRGQIYFGELTFYPGGGMEEFTPSEWDKTLGDWIPLSRGEYLLEGDTFRIWLHSKMEFRSQDSDLLDYKFFCFHGKPEFCQVISNRSTDERIDFYDMEWNHQEFTGLSVPGHPFANADMSIKQPQTFYKMKEVAKILSEGHPFLRVDFYEVSGQMYFGELTFFPASGFGVFEPNQWNLCLGEMIHLPQKRK